MQDFLQTVELMMFFMPCCIVHTTLYIGLSGVGYVERHSLHKVTTRIRTWQLSVWLCSNWLSNIINESVRLACFKL